jgi:PAS domain S-box-containing protein
MGISNKIILILIFAISLSILCLGFFTRSLLLNSFLNLEVDQVYRNKDRFNNILAQEINILKASALDYGAWDESYAYAKGENPNYLENNISDNIFLNFKINYLIYYDIDGNFLYARAYDFLKENELEVPLEFNKISIQAKSFLANANSISAKSGVIKIDNKPVLLVAQPILNNNEEGPAVGTIIFGRIFDAEEIKFFEDYIQFKIELMNTQEFNQRFSNNINIRQILNKNSSAHFIKNKQIINGFVLIKDLNNEPVTIASIEFSRDIFQEGNKLIKIFLIIFTIASIILILIIFILLKYLVISRLIKLRNQVNKIGHSGNFSEKIKINGHDEIFILSEDVNKMLATLNKSSEKLLLSEKRFSDISENAREWIWELDKNGRIKYSNNVITQILGYKFEETIDKDLCDFAYSDDRDNLKLIIKNGSQNKKPFNYVKIRFLHKENKEIVYLLLSGLPVLNSDKVIALRGVGIDMTENQKVEEELKQKNNELKKFNKLFIDRELKMIELKEKNKNLEAKKTVN